MSQPKTQNSKPKTQNPKLKTLEDARSWTKENGFIFPSSEIYGGFAAVYDYGHLGYLLKENIKRAWEKSMFQERNDVISLDSGIFMHPKTWVASGHVASFGDVLVEDKKTNIRYRADHVIEEWFEAKGEKVDMDKKTPQELAIVIKENNIKSPAGNELSEPREFNLLVKTNLGSTDAQFTEENVVYPRGETCQGIYLNYKNMQQSYRMKLPFGIAQVGKAIRNEIIARQFIFRTREFEQMEMQYFLHPRDMEKFYEEWKQARIDWHINVLGINPERLRFKKHEKLAHYASAAYDIEYNYGSLGGFKELEGIHARGDWDLGGHSKASGEKMEYFDQERNERFIPHVMETSVGLNRCVMMVIEDSLVDEEFEKENGEKDIRTVMKIKKSLAPIKIAFLPLSKKPELVEKTLEVQGLLRSKYMTQYDETASIGKRYRRQDEIGTPYCVTVDFDTLNDNAVTIRDRDTMEQVRIKIEDLSEWFERNLK